jgi:hypothetical protein
LNFAFVVLDAFFVWMRAKLREIFADAVRAPMRL